MELAGKLTFSHIYYLYIFAFIIFPATIFLNSKTIPNKSYNLEFLSKDTTASIKGISITIVVLHHFSQYMDDPGLMYPFTLIGYLSVSMFFFFSGFGLMISFINKKDYLKNFFTKRLSKVYLPFVAVNALTLLMYRYLYHTSFTFSETLAYLAGFKLIDEVLWFVKAILLFYIIFFAAFRFFSKKIGILVIIAFSLIYSYECYKITITEPFGISLGIWWFNAVFCFPVGVIIALYYEKFIKLLQNNYISISLFSICFFAASFYLVHIDPSEDQSFFVSSLFDSLSSVFFVFVMLSVLFKVKLSSRPMQFIGIISYEIYLIHMKIFFSYFNSSSPASGLTVYIYLVLVVLSAFLIHSFSKIYLK